MTKLTRVLTPRFQKDYVAPAVLFFCSMIAVSTALIIVTAVVQFIKLLEYNVTTTLNITTWIK